MGGVGERVNPPKFMIRFMTSSRISFFFTVPFPLRCSIPSMNAAVPEGDERFFQTSTISSLWKSSLSRIIQTASGTRDSTARLRREDGPGKE
jgi:hypothetical protein